MKTKFIFILIAIVLASSLKAQNLVPDPSFEFGRSPFIGTIYHQKDFFLYDTSFLNVTMPGWATARPYYTWSGIDFSSGGVDSLLRTDNAYLHNARTGIYNGLIYLGGYRPDSLSDSLGNEHAYLQTRLISPLIGGQTYTFTIYVSGQPLQVLIHLLPVTE